MAHLFLAGACCCNRRVSGQGVCFGLGNNSVEVIEIFAGTRVHEITGVPGPQGVAFFPETNPYGSYPPFIHF